MRFPRALSHFLAGLTIFEGWIVSGCGGGSSGAPPAPQPPVAGSFAVQLNPASITVVAGDTVRTTVSIQAFNGFSGQVTLTVTGLPSGATALFASNPVGAGQSVDLTFTTTANTQAQTASLQIQGKSGTLTDVQTATLKVVGKPTGMAPLSGYVAVDGPLFDSTYDPVHRLAFAANPQLNRIEVLSPETLQRVATIPVPQAVTLDTTPDGSLLWVGTSSYYLFAVDPATLQVVNRVLPTGGALGTLSFGRTLSTTSNGSLLINRGSKLAQFFPATGQVVDRSREASAGALFRSADGSKVLDASSIPTLYDALTDSFLTNPSEQGTEFACIRPDGSQVAMLGLSKSTPGSVDLVFLDAQLKEIGRIPGMNFAGLPVYSRDGRFLYLPMDITILRQSPEIAVFDTRSMTRVGSVPDIFRSSDPPTWHFSTPGGTTLIAADANGVLMGPGPCGFDFVDARNPHSLSGNAP